MPTWRRCSGRPRAAPRPGSTASTSRCRSTSSGSAATGSTRPARGSRAAASSWAKWPGRSAIACAPRCSKTCSFEGKSSSSRSNSSSARPRRGRRAPAGEREDLAARGGPGAGRAGRRAGRPRAGEGEGRGDPDRPGVGHRSLGPGPRRHRAGMAGSGALSRGVASRASGSRAPQSAGRPPRPRRVRRRGGGAGPRAREAIPRRHPRPRIPLRSGRQEVHPRAVDLRADLQPERRPDRRGRGEAEGVGRPLSLDPGAGYRRLRGGLRPSQGRPPAVAIFRETFTVVGERLESIRRPVELGGGRPATLLGAQLEQSIVEFGAFEALRRTQEALGGLEDSLAAAPGRRAPGAGDSGSAAPPASPGKEKP